MYENKELCTQCKGLCCKIIPGANFPDDFDIKNGIGKLVNALKSGKYCIDHIMGGYDNLQIQWYVRPHIKGESGLYSHTWNNDCVFLAENGCQLEAEERPHNCRYLEPKPEDVLCVNHDRSKAGAVLEWLPYKDLLASMAKYMD